MHRPISVCRNALESREPVRFGRLTRAPALAFAPQSGTHLSKSRSTIWTIAASSVTTATEVMAMVETRAE